MYALEKNLMSLMFTIYAYASNNIPSYIHISSYSLSPEMIVRASNFGDIKAH